MYLNQYQSKITRSQRAFSLIEMLVVIAVIGIIAAIGTSSVSNVNDSAKMARDQRNAQNFCSMFNGATVSGVTFASNTKEALLDELIGGVTNPTNGMHYQMSPLSDDAKTAALDYCEYDAGDQLMKYSSEGGVGGTTPSQPAAPQWGPWQDFQLILNSQLVGRLDQMRAQMPDREWRWVPNDPYIHNMSLIQFRSPL